ncbi:MAG: hypothetical protein RLY71_4406 [Pseudomonadota bacterium]|jgi:hypothetical protein
MATVWGVRQGATLYFTHVNGESLPSRGGGGYPVSLALPPGKHTIRVFLAMPDNRSTEQSVSTVVEAGNTYVTEFLAIPGTSAILLKLVNLGKGQQCSYTNTGQVRTALVLHCTPRTGA